MSFGPRNLVTLILVLLVPAVVFGEVPDIDNCDIFTRATEDVSVMICPACDGYAFSAAQTFGGAPMDATIEVYIRNNAGVGLEGISASDIWLEETGISFCSPDGNIADFNTIAGGYTEFALPACGGGCSENLTLGGYLAGTPFNQNPLPYIRFNSPDTNGDLVVDLIDLSAFAVAYFIPATYCFDYNWDGVMNLLDLAVFSQHYTHACN